jgi:hypothetical protein
MASLADGSNSAASSSGLIANFTSAYSCGLPSIHPDQRAVRRTRDGRTTPLTDVVPSRSY